MDSLKIFKGYGKVSKDNHNNDLEDQQLPQRKPFKPITLTISIFAILFLTLTLALALAIAALIHHTNAESPDSPSESIRAACAVTRFPNSCFSTISSSINNTATKSTTTIGPQTILKLSLGVSIDELTKLRSYLSASNGGGAAVADCKDQVDDAVSRLNDSMLAVEAAVKGNGLMTEMAMADVRTWVSAAVTDQQTCLDGLEEMRSPAAAEMKRKMERCGEYTSNSLAIVANMKTLFERFHMPIHS